MSGGCIKINRPCYDRLGNYDSLKKEKKKKDLFKEERKREAKKNQRMQKITTDTILISVFIEIGLYKVQKMSFYTKL